MEKPLLLEVKNLSVNFHREDSVTHAVDSVSFTLREGETLGIVGESGSGKSVTALSILKLIDPPSGIIDKGEIFFTSNQKPPVDLLQLPEKEIRHYRGKEISMIFQEPMTSLNPVLTCGSQIMETLLAHLPMKRKAAKIRTIELLNEVMLPRPKEIFRSYPHQLSGGQKQRIMIAMAISCNPRILIADEPTTALDVTVQKNILDLLKSLQEKHRMSILFITHDLSLVAGFANRVIVMYKGKIVEEGIVNELFDHPRHPYTKGLLNCRPPLDIRLRKLSVLADFMDNEKEKGEGEGENIISKEERKGSHLKLYSQPPILEVRELVTRFAVSTSLWGKTKQYLNAVNNVSFAVFPGETMGIVGESGCGKTTLGRSILNLIKSSSGKILFEGKELSALPADKMREMRKDLQIIFQDPYSSLNPRIMVGSAIMEPMKVHGLYENTNSRREKTLELLFRVGLEEKHFYRYPHEFSGGQRQRVCIARALALNPKMIICDESVSALDISIQAQVLNLLNDLKREFNFTYLFISHDLSVVRFMSDQLIVMKDGKIEEMGNADEIYSAPKSPYTQKLIEAIPRIN